MKDRRKETGRLGEDLALAYLLEQGYQLITRNFSCKLGEIDLIVTKDGQTVFVEVRSLRSHQFGRPEESISQSKKDRVRRIAQYYLHTQSAANQPVRFDVIAVMIGLENQAVSLNHIPAAF
jgi:putative endonuclease